MGVKSALMTFAPHPQAVLRGEPVPIISTLPLRLRLFEELGLGSAYLRISHGKKYFSMVL